MRIALLMASLRNAALIINYRQRKFRLVRERQRERKKKQFAKFLETQLRCRPA